MSNSSPAAARRSMARSLLRAVERGLAIIGLAVVLYYCMFRLNVIVSPSMQPTLQGTNWNDGDRVLTEKISYWFHPPRRWQVISFRREDGVVVMKRVIGLPGETIQMTREGELLVNHEHVRRPAGLEHLHYVPIAKLHQDREVACGDGYFVLGDDSRDSDDSRYNGPIPGNSILGRSWIIVSPWSRFGWVN